MKTKMRPNPGQRGSNVDGDSNVYRHLNRADGLKSKSANSASSSLSCSCSCSDPAWLDLERRPRDCCFFERGSSSSLSLSARDERLRLLLALLRRAFVGSSTTSLLSTSVLRCRFFFLTVF